jgi:HSP20 family protein
MRTVQLPAEVVAEQTDAVVQNGVLRLRLPKAESARPRKVKVEVKP